MKAWKRYILVLSLSGALVLFPLALKGLGGRDSEAPEASPDYLSAVVAPKIDEFKANPVPSPDEIAWANASSAQTIEAYQRYIDGGHDEMRARAKQALALHRGAIGKLQSALNAAGFHAGPADGLYGRQTDDALEAFAAAAYMLVDKSVLSRVDPLPIEGLADSVRSWKPVGTVFRDGLRSGERGPLMMVLPPATFTMGATEEAIERYNPGRRYSGLIGDQSNPQRQVSIDYWFAVGVYEVTWEQWELCVAAGHCAAAVKEHALEIHRGGGRIRIALLWQRFSGTQH